MVALAYNNDPLVHHKISAHLLTSMLKAGEFSLTVRLTSFATRLPRELSGGQRQRVEVLRALVSRPKLLLLDEPLSLLDAKLREQMQIELINLQKEVDITFVYVTHDQGEALAFSHRIAVMNRGNVQQLEEPSSIYSYPRTRFVADFIGTCNLFDGAIASIDGASMQLDLPCLGLVKSALPADAAAGRKGTLALRPEKIHISTDTPENHFKGFVKELLYLGDVTVYIGADRRRRKN